MNVVHSRIKFVSFTCSHVTTWYCMGTNNSLSLFHSYGNQSFRLCFLFFPLLLSRMMCWPSTLFCWHGWICCHFSFVLLLILSSTDEFYELLISTRSFSNQLLRCLWTLYMCEVMCGVLLVMVGCCWNEHFPEMLNLHSPNHFHGTLFYYSLVKILCDIYLPILWTWPFTLLKAVLSFNTTSIKI